MADMAKSGVKDYLKDFPQPALTKIDSAAIQAEIARVTNQQRPDTSLCDVYVSADAPNSNEVTAWQQSLDRAKINFTVAEQRRLNLELDKQYGPTVWKEHLKQCGNMQETMGV